jgi:hypothetical protein
MLPSAFPLDLFGFETYTFLVGGRWHSHSFSTRLRVLKCLYIMSIHRNPVAENFFFPLSSRCHVIKMRIVHLLLRLREQRYWS